MVLGLLWRLSSGDVTPSQAVIIAQLEWYSLLLFIPAAWVLKRWEKHLHWLLLIPGFNGFGLHHVPFGMQASLALISLATLGPAAVKSLQRYRIPTAIALALCALLITQALTRSGSRAGVITLLVGLVVLIWLRRSDLTAALKTPRGALSLTIGAVLMLGALGANYENLHKRFVVDSVHKASFSLSLDDMSRDKDIFPDRRIFLSAFGLEKWQEKPLFGHGTTSVKPLLKADPDFHIHPHLHNIYVQALVELGLLGTLTWLAVSLALLLGVRKYARQQPKHLVGCFWATGIALAIWSLQSAEIHTANWRFSVIMVMALGTALTHNGRQPNNKP